VTYERLDATEAASAARVSALESTTATFDMLFDNGDIVEKHNAEVVGLGSRTALLGGSTSGTASPKGPTMRCACASAWTMDASLREAPSAPSLAAGQRSRACSGSKGMRVLWRCTCRARSRASTSRSQIPRSLPPTSSRIWPTLTSSPSTSTGP
nr:ribonuclease H [Zea mays]